MSTYLLCNGEVDCVDGKDESLRICGELTILVTYIRFINQKVHATTFTGFNNCWPLVIFRAKLPNGQAFLKVVGHLT